MFTELYWIDGPWIARPGLPDEMKSWRKNGIDVVVSLLTPSEVDDLDLGREAQYCIENHIQFHVFPIVDRSVPSSDGEALELLDRLDADLDSGKNVVVHCRQGIGRAGLIAASLLIARGLSPVGAMERVSAARQAASARDSGTTGLAHFYAFK